MSEQAHEVSRMMIDLTTIEAKSQGLPGSDVFKYTHLIYLDELHRDHGVVNLCQEALKLICDSILVGNRKEIAAEFVSMKKWSETYDLTSGAPMPDTPYSDASMHYQNIENIKIASGFELILKAILLQKNYIVHEINKELPPYRSIALAQKISPISKYDLLSIDGFRFNGQTNYLPGLRKNSISFSTIVQKSEYTEKLQLKSGDPELIDELRELRNQIHLPGDVAETLRLQALGIPLIEYIISFMNTNIVDRCNPLIARHNFNWPPLRHLSVA